MNDTHANLTKSMLGLKPPRFTYENKGDVLFMTYHSSRNYPHYFEGILRGAAEFFKQRVEISLDIVNEETARAKIVFI